MTMTKKEDVVMHYASLYNKVGLWIVAAVTILSLLAEQIAARDAFTYSILFSGLYFLVVTMLNGYCWRKAARKSGSGLTRFYLAPSAVRMLLAFVVVLIGAFAFCADKTKLLGFTLVFAFYYVLLLIYDCIFFSHIEKKHLII